MSKKKKTHHIFYIPLLFLIIPISLYINFFFFKLTYSAYEVKAWVIYSLLLIIGEITVIIVSNSIFLFLNKRFKILSTELRDKFILIGIYGFLLGNVLLSMAVFERVMYLYLPIFQSLIILLLSFKYINKHLIKKEELSIIKRILTIKKIKRKVKLEKNYISILVIITLYTFLNMVNLFYVKVNYNPLRKSLEYFNNSLGGKVKFQIK